MNPKYCCEVEPENVPDLVAVVRCKDCKHSSIAWDDGQQFCEKEGEWRDPDFFCKWGNRKDGDGE